MITKFSLFEANVIPFIDLSLNEKWILYHELEYKFSRIKDTFKNERQENVFERIKRKLDSIVTTLIKTFYPIYNDYLIGHKGIYRQARYSGEFGKKYVKQYENISDLFDQANELQGLSVEKKIILLEKLKDAAHATNIMASHYQDTYNDVEEEGFDFDNFEDLDVSQWEQELRMDGFIKESVKSNKWEIPVKLIPYQDIKGDFDNIDEWKTKIILCNSGGEGDEVGKWDEVGYVGVSYADDNLIIPIARADEHQAGYELMGHLLRRKMIPHEKFKSVWTGNSTNYIWAYDVEDYRNYYIAYKKFLEYGGRNTALLIKYEENYRGQEMEIDLKTFVKNEGDLSKLKKYQKDAGIYSDNGKELYEFFMFLSYKLNDYHNPKPVENRDKWYSPTTPKDIADYIHREIKVLNKIKFMNTLFYKNELIRAANKFDVAKIEELLYSHNGLKNTIHMMLRKKDKKLKPFFGNLDIALQRFSQLSAMK